MLKFHIKKSSPGYSFTFNAPNGKIILRSDVYKAEKSSIKGIESIQINAANARFENHTEPDVKLVKNPKFQMYSDIPGEYRFRLNARNGEIIGESEPYKTRNSCLKGIQSVRDNAAGAFIFKDWQL